MPSRTHPFFIPALVRIKPGALDRLGVYLARAGHRRILLLVSTGLQPALGQRLEASLARDGIFLAGREEVDEASFEHAATLFSRVPPGCEAVVGFGGGRALDVAKYVAFLAGLSYLAVPTSLSNDGFCSPQSSLTQGGRRRSLRAAMPSGVVVDTDVCLHAPDVLWWSGVGDLVAKVTAIADWKLAFHARGTPVNDFAALLSDATVFQFMARPVRDLEGVRLLATSLMLNGIAMEVSGSSRPASGSEHLMSHALDTVSRRPRLHGLQVGVATYVVSRLQGQGTERVAAVLDATGFWRGITQDPFSRREWLEAVRLAPTLKDDFHTVLSTRDCAPEVEKLLRTDSRLERCFTD
ncbi:iron-containing alcohol dehydrogenase family protein [Pyxidicoccus fallax]|uniref:Iron-containing alcohol dehydrogenase family protein n=2 Tax=Pyxidicoccus fallax TaxID=394095 RepID=A0A848LA11_9BACT|nr:iron-containing alcohol dehydrogenase family protein [Pyxidicoccus fallax]NMO15890.1 iron-containing alcohol dehydrogenase family protein [Pyxidicoccus fallax]NPC81336.1 iron-containing alcohol dehydrogenase family protein [Pyxidicoccus fallax]